jgi:hypothetical protein
MRQYLDIGDHYDLKQRRVVLIEVPIMAALGLLAFRTGAGEVTLYAAKGALALASGWCFPRLMWLDVRENRKLNRLDAEYQDKLTAECSEKRSRTLEATKPVKSAPSP